MVWVVRGDGGRVKDWDWGGGYYMAGEREMRCWDEFAGRDGEGERLIAGVGIGRADFGRVRCLNNTIQMQTGAGK